MEHGRAVPDEPAAVADLADAITNDDTADSVDAGNHRRVVRNVDRFNGHGHDTRRRKRHRIQERNP